MIGGYRDERNAWDARCGAAGGAFHGHDGGAARCGAWDTHYTEHLFDAWFRILVLDCPGCASLAPETVVEALADCYRRTISPTQWQKHVQFFAPDGSVCG